MKGRTLAFIRRHAGTAAFLGSLLIVSGAFFAAAHFLPQPGASSYPEAAQVSNERWSFQQYSDYFRQLALKKGAPYAFQVMLRADFPQGIDLHLLGHVVGDVLYKQKGIAGIQYCTEDFRDACSHSIVVGALLERGPSALAEITQACKEAPGGRGAYTMCFHGLGHGVLAYTDYDMQKAVQMCKQVGTPQYGDQEYTQCVGGTMMEMVSGVHDPTAWDKQKANYFKADDPLFPCDARWMPEEPRSMCYDYLTPHLFEAAGSDYGRPDPKTFPKAFSFCGAIPADAAHQPDRAACYGGFGKDFIGLVVGRDIRNVGSTPAPALAQLRDWCAMAGDAQGTIDCDQYVLGSLFWGGETAPDAALAFCGLLDGAPQDACYRELGGVIAYYHANDGKAEPLCTRLPEAYRSSCVLPS